MKLFHIPVREKIGRAKMVSQDKFEEEYNGLVEEMKAEIAKALEGGDQA
jgi:hypothetical protein